MKPNDKEPQDIEPIYRSETIPGKIPVVTLIASGYDWECPDCGEFNHTTRVPKGGKILQCKYCKSFAEPSEDFFHTYE